MSTDQEPPDSFWDDWFARHGHTGWTNPAIYRHDQRTRVRSVLSALRSLGFGYRPDQRVLDIGCGTGDIVAALADRGVRVVGYDISSGVIEQARQRFRGRPNVTLECANLVDASIEHGPYDLITSVTVLQHQVTDEALHTVLVKLRDALTPGGHLVMIEAVVPEDAAGHLSEHYVRPRTRSQWLAHLHQAGLALEFERAYPQSALTVLGWIRGAIRKLRPKRPDEETPTSPAADEPARTGGAKTLAFRGFLAAFVPLDHWLRVPTPKSLGVVRVMAVRRAG